MRVSTAHQYQLAIAQMMQQQEQLQATQLQLSSGKKILSPSDDPSGSRQLMSLKQSQASLVQFDENMNRAESRLAQTEDAMAQVENILQRVRELALQANSGSQSESGLKAIATELGALNKQMLNLANSRDQSGGYLFAGFRSGTAPFAISGSTVQYHGDEGQRKVQIAADARVQTHDPGSGVFMHIPSGNGQFQTRYESSNQGELLIGATSSTAGILTSPLHISFSQPLVDGPLDWQVRDPHNNLLASGLYEEGMRLEYQGHRLELSGKPADGDRIDLLPPAPQDIFARVDNLVETLSQPLADARDRNLLANRLARSLESLDHAWTSISGYRSELGSRLQMLDMQRQVNQDFSLYLDQQVSAIRDLDLTEAISRLNLQMVGLQAAQQAYVKVQGLSLFNHI